jgi:hypothetical protein
MPKHLSSAINSSVGIFLTSSQSLKAYSSSSRVGCDKICSKSLLGSLVCFNFLFLTVTWPRIGSARLNSGLSVCFVKVMLNSSFLMGVNVLFFFWVFFLHFVCCRNSSYEAETTNTSACFSLNFWSLFFVIASPGSARL